MARSTTSRRSTALLILALVVPVAPVAGAPAEDHPPAALVRDLAPGPEGMGPAGFYPLGDRILAYTFELLDTSGDSFLDFLFSSQLVVSDGTAPGTVPLLPEDVTFAWWYPEAGSSGLNFFAACESPVRLEAGCTERDVALWRTDGTADGTYPVADRGALDGDATTLPDGLYVRDRGLYFFRGTDPEAEQPDFELWVSNGTRSGTRLVADLNPEGPSYPSEMVALGPWAYFIHRVDRGGEPRWFVGRSDGTRAGTEARPGPSDPNAVPFDLWRGDDEVFVFYEIRGERLSLWRDDGGPDGPTLLEAELGPRTRYNDLRVLGVGGDTLFFLTGTRGVPIPSDAHLWASDGTPEGTRRLPRPPGLVLHDGYTYRYPRVVGDHVYFVLDDGVHGEEPWMSDGTPEGTRMIRDMCPGACRSPLTNIYGFQPFLGDVMLAVDAGDEPYVPRVYDPESGEIRVLRALCRDGCGGTRVVANTTERAYILSYQEAYGWELWTTDGTPGSAERLTDFEDEIYAFRYHLYGRAYEPGPWEVAGGRLYFGARDAEHGWELWAQPVLGRESEPAAPFDREPLTSSALPGFDVWVEITPGGGAPIPGRAEPECIPETLCVSGAIPGRSEVFVRVVGPKPNGLLWPTLVKFTTSTVDVWIEQRATGVRRHYRLEGASPGSSDLPGLFDRDGFSPP